MQGCVCPVTGKEHKFKPMMVESLPPDNGSMGAVGINDVNPGEDGGFDADERTQLILALTIRRYSIVCEACGAVAGGFQGNVKEEKDSGAAGQG